MNINISSSDLLKHLSFWYNKTDDECMVYLDNNQVDAEQSLLNMVERDFCTSVNNEVINQLKQQIEN